MLIPVGLDDSKVSRVPVVSVAILALCVLGYLLSFSASDNAEESVGEVIQYYYTHRGLELPADFKQRLGISADDVGDAEDFGFPEMGMDEDFELIPEDVDQGAVEELRAEQQEELNRLAAAAIEALDNRFEMKWGYVPGNPSFVGLITCMFLHGGILHLIGNMLFLYFTAPFLEDRWGRPFFAAFYLLGGIAATLGFSATHSDSMVPLIGASGAISAVMGAFTLKLGTRKMTFLLQTGFLRYTFDSPAWVMLPIFFTRDVANALAFDSGTGVAHWAHVWGFVFGAGTAYSMKLLGYDRQLNTAIFDPDYPERHPIQGADHLLRKGKPEQALQLLSDSHTKMPDFEELAIAYWNLALKMNEAPHAQRVGKRLLGGAIREGALDDALTYWKTLEERYAPPLEGPDLSRLMELMTKNGRDRDAMKILWTAFTAPESSQYGASQFMALTVAATKISPDAAREIASQALSVELSPKQRKYMEAVVAWADQIAAMEQPPVKEPPVEKPPESTPGGGPLRFSSE